MEQEKGEPPPKRVRLAVDINFNELDLGTEHMLRAPLTDVLHRATVVTEEYSDGAKLNRTIGMVQGVMSKRINGHVNYRGIISASPEKVALVRENLDTHIANFRLLYKIDEHDVRVAEEESSADAATNSFATRD